MLLHHQILFRALVVMAIVALLHSLALTFYFYWQLWWFDIVMHFLGGIVVGLGAMWALTGYASRRDATVSARQSFSLVLLAIFIVAVSWEIFEFQFELFDPVGYGVDASLDIFMGVLGALGAHRYARGLLRRKE